MHDLVIRNGIVVDGTGAARRVADVAVKDGIIVAVGRDVGPGKREIAADGLLVTPGFVDIHTHYDGQATWDPLLTPSSWHGVTTTVFGNCGVGFAPVHKKDVPYLINLMEGVEDIPESVLNEGVKFDWESFPDYLDSLAAMPRVVDIGAQVPHAALRFYVMGERGAEHAEVPTEAEIGRMGKLLEESLAAGALGFSTSRTTKHRAKDGRLTPSLTARESELFGLAEAMRRAGTGVLQVNSDFGAGEFEALSAAAKVAGRPLSVLLIQVNNAPDLWRKTLDQIHAARKAGIDANGQVGARCIGIVMGLETTMHPFAAHPAWNALDNLSPEERFRLLQTDADLRRRLVEDRPTDGATRWMGDMLARVCPLGDTPDYEPDPKTHSIVAMAQAKNASPWAVALDLMMAGGGKGLLMLPFENYSEGSLDVVREMIVDEATVMGVADGGAHVGVICDSSAPTYLLTHWARDRKRGDRLPLEFLVKKQTRDTAQSYGLNDRGVIAPGYRADLNVIDFDALRVLRPEVVYDLPAGGRRLIQKGAGYRHTIVAGVETLANGEFTGAKPGRLIRGPQKVA